MIIDDSFTIRKTAEGFLKETEYELILVENGYEALTKIMDLKPDLILCDLNMPKLEGFEMCKILKQNEEYEDIPIIILSSSNGLLDISKGKLNGCDDYLIKPFKKEILLEVIKKYLK